MPASLRRRVVVVTGASAGIGRAAAIAFAREGARVAVAARRAERLEQLRAEIEAAGGECLPVPTDVGDREQVERLLVETVRCYGRVDIWINNAGYGLLGTVEQTSAEEMTRMWETNYMGVFHGCQAALRQMREQGEGHIMNVSSMVARLPLPLSAAYTATKSAVQGLSDALALEVEGSGIRVSTLMVGLTATEFGEAQVKKIRATPAPFGPAASAEAVAARIVRCARRPQPLVVFAPLPPLTLAIFDLFPGAWRLMARHYVRMRTR